MTTYRNAEESFMGELSEIDLTGHEISVRGSLTRELTARTFQIVHPTERYISVQGRLNNVAATVAETVWVLAGRNDLDFLTRYLPRAPDFSDDGMTWRAGYGPRLRNWQGTDQLSEVVKLLRSDPTSRRGVIGLFDPATDFTNSRDVPCNNWIHFIQRNNRLDMAIAVRSNDVIWGFSGINTFEWSVLHEVVARAIGAHVGSQQWLVNSFHLYERHFDRAASMLRLGPGTGVYDRGATTVTYEGPWEDLQDHLDEWFRVEDMIRQGSGDVVDAVDAYPDPLFRTFLRVVHGYWLMRAGNMEGARRAIDPMKGTDAGIAMGDYLARHSSADEADGGTVASTGNSIALGDLRGALRTLHRRKSAAYGDSWKRRGELVGVLANVARKVDRLENLEGFRADDPESWSDTITDLAIYLIKYLTFLADADSGVAETLFASDSASAYSNGVEGFEVLLADLEPAEREPRTALADLVSMFEQLEVGARRDTLPMTERARMAAEMARLCMSLLIRHPGTRGTGAGLG
jgi:thymidylate synthase